MSSSPKILKQQDNWVFLPAKLFYFRTLQDMSNALEE